MHEPTDAGRQVGRGSDADPAARPGVPRASLPAPAAGAHWERPAQQRGVALLARSGLRAATPVFGTAQPAHGVAGAVRRAAYGVPEHRAGRWVLLFAADRLDVLGHRAAAWLLPAAIALALGYAVVSRAVERR